MAAFEKTADVVVERSCHEAGELPSALGAGCAAGCAIDAVVIDAEMFDGHASDAVHAVRRLAPGIAVLLLTTRVDQPLLEAVAVERVSCVSAYSEANAIVSALRALLGGRIDLPSDVQRALMDLLRHPPPAPAVTPLTSREEQVLALAATGLTISEIAARLHISHSTAKTHLLRVYEKLEAPNRSAAVAIAAARGMLRLSAAAA